MSYYDRIKAGPVPRGVPRPKALVVKKFPFYRCGSCRRLFTYREEQKVMTSKTERLNVCPCGARTYRPTNPVGLEWVLPKVVVFLALNLIFDY